MISEKKKESAIVSRLLFLQASQEVMAQPPFHMTHHQRKPCHANKQFLILKHRPYHHSLHIYMEMSLISYPFISFLFLSCLKGLLITENREEIIGSATYQKERSQPPLEPILLPLRANPHS